MGEAAAGGRDEPLSRVERKRQARQEKMIEIALEIVREDGLDALTIKRIAEEMDLVMGAIYRYFPSKNALLVSLQLRALEQLHETFMKQREQVAAYLQTKGPSDEKHRAAAQLWVAVHTYFSYKLHAPAYYGLLDSLLSSPRSFFESEQDSNSPLLLALLSSVAGDLSQASSGAFDQTLSMQYAHVLWATLHGLGHFRKRDPKLPEHLRSNHLQPLAIRGLLLGWGLPQTLVDEGQKSAETFLTTQTQPSND